MPADMKDSIAEAARKLSWMLERNGEKLVDEALAQESAELRQMLFDGCYRFFK